MQLSSTRRGVRLQILLVTGLIIFQVYAWHDSAMHHVDVIATALENEASNFAAVRTDRLKEHLTVDFYGLVFCVGAFGLIAAVLLSMLKRDELFEYDEPNRPLKAEE